MVCATSLSCPFGEVPSLCRRSQLSVDVPCFRVHAHFCICTKAQTPQQQYVYAGVPLASAA